MISKPNELWIVIPFRQMVTAHTSILVLLQVDTATPLPLLVAQMPWSDCCEGELGEVLEYLRKSKYLSLPEEWLEHI